MIKVLSFSFVLGVLDYFGISLKDAARITRSSSRYFIDARAKHNFYELGYVVTVVHLTNE